MTTNYQLYFDGDPNDIKVCPPMSESANPCEDKLIQKVVRMVTNEILRQEHKNILHETIFVPAIHQFVVFLRPWLLILSSIFLLLLIIGVFQLILLFTRKQIISQNFQSV